MPCVKTLRRYLITGTVIAVLVVGAVALWDWKVSSWFTTDSTTTALEQITEVKPIQEVALLSLGIEGLLEQSDAQEVMGMRIPGSGRVVLLQYEFTAKLGIEGEDVKITPTGENTFRVSIPEFVFIGHSDTKFGIANEENGILSWVTPDIDTTGMVNTVLGLDAQKEYIKEHSQELQDQATLFYTTLLTSVAPDVSLEFEFEGGTPQSQ